jgi:hypothetical protein
MQITVTDLFDGVTPETSPITITVVEGTATAGGGGVSDHGALTGLGDDDHTQYHTDARGDARYWPLSTDLATQAELDAHAADTTSVHGIADTSVLATDAEVSAAVAAHEAAVDPHPTYLTQAEADALYEDAGAAAAAQAAAEATAAGALTTHTADTTAVHGIADTSALETTTGSQAKVDAHTGDTSDAHDASAISFSPTGTIAATDVQAAIEEVASEATGGAIGGWPTNYADNTPSSPHAKDDEFDGTTLTSWTTTPTAPSVMDTNSTAAGKLYIETPVSSAALRGKYQSIPSYPFACAAKLTSHTATAGSSRTGIFIAPSGPTNATGTYHISWIQNLGAVAVCNQQFGGTFGSNAGSSVQPSQPLYLQILCTSATSVSFLVSLDGVIWTTIVTLNPAGAGITPGVMGLYASSEGLASPVTARFEWFRIKTF